MHVSEQHVCYGVIEVVIMQLTKKKNDDVWLVSKSALCVDI